MGTMGEMVREHLMERRPVPTEMTVEESFEWLSEYCGRYEWVEATPVRNGYFRLECEGISETHGSTLALAVGLAAAKLDEANS